MLVTALLVKPMGLMAPADSNAAAVLVLELIVDETVLVLEVPVRCMANNEYGRHARSRPAPIESVIHLGEINLSLLSTLRGYKKARRRISWSSGYRHTL